MASKRLTVTCCYGTENVEEILRRSFLLFLRGELPEGLCPQEPPASSRG